MAAPRPPIDLFGSFVKGVTTPEAPAPAEQAARSPAPRPFAGGLDAVMKMLASQPQGVAIGDPALITAAGGSLGQLVDIIGKLESLRLAQRNDGTVRLTTAGLAAAAAVTV